MPASRRVVRRGITKAMHISAAIDFPPGLWYRLVASAREKNVGVRVWIKALLMEAEGLHPGLTKESADNIKRIVRGK